MNRTFSLMCSPYEFDQRRRGEHGDVPEQVAGPDARARHMGKKKAPATTSPTSSRPRPEEAALSGPTPKFGQALASSDKDVRDKAVKALERYLRRAHDIEELELRKIWKALFYCMWHSDKPKVQAELADKLGGLVHSVAPGREWLFVRVFWQTMVREWTGIDRLRLDKFYKLIRRSLVHCVARVRESGWSDHELQAFAAALSAGPLNVECPASIRFFMADYFWAIVATGREAADGLTEKAVCVLLEPFVALLGVAEDSVVIQRVVNGVLEPLTRRRGKADGKDMEEDETDEKEDDEDDEDEDDEDDEEVPLPRPLGWLAERVFDLASAKTTHERNRKQLYELQVR